MKHNVYDFDKTIYRKDSSFDFYRFCLKRHPRMLAEIPALSVWAVRFLLGACTKTILKEKFYRFLRYIDSVDDLVSEFWNANRHKIAAYYPAQHEAGDVVISASPEFLLRPVCNDLGITHLIASRVEKHTGVYDGENCWGEEKVRRFREEMGDDAIHAFYSDSLSDTPLAGIAEEAYLVRKHEIVPWRF